MSLETQITLATTSGFVTRVKAAMVKAAIAVRAEEDTVPDHAARVALAHKTLLDPDTWAGLFAHGVAANPAITEQSIDSDIEFTVNSLWEAYTDPAAPA